MPSTVAEEAVDQKIRDAFTGGERDVRAALFRLTQALAPMRLSEEETGTVELVLGEVLNNVVEHAYGSTATGDIRLSCRRTDRGLSFCVFDGGQALPGRCLPPGAPPDTDVARENLPEGGFGWFLVKSLTTELRYTRRGGCNVLRFSIPLGPARAGGASGTVLG
ncbi:ATP-binding protein [Marimonas arenosa]|uniref:ATP-binding protein n=1 Tax=Marimonas arenosa TaxID=1795305 RepID=A0AAE3WCY6_9RHOB|nr:ATP-binding protein [Marimonas arenosa]MDQ2090429.1 ATP-binding protein [Marimonas arenosa]